jgi:membrane protein
LSFLHFTIRVVRRMRDVGLMRTASSLSFTTLLAIVPIVTIALAFVAQFPIFEQWISALETFLVKNALPGYAAGVVHQYVLTFAEQATRLTRVSILIIAVTAALAIFTVDREINLIWGINRGRKWPRRIAMYLLVMTAGPVLIGASISLTTWLIGESLGAVIPRSTLGQTVFRALPFLFATTGLSLMYKAVPARPVRVVPAAIGGAAAALALEAAKYGFALYVARVSTYEVVYGALAALPVFLLWIHLCWIIVLAGAAITATLSDAPARRTG